MHGLFQIIIEENLNIIRDFTYHFSNLLDSLKKLIEPLQHLKSKDEYTQQASFASTQYSFFPEQRVTTDSIKNYKNIHIKYFIKGRYI